MPHYNASSLSQHLLLHTTARVTISGRVQMKVTANINYQKKREEMKEPLAKAFLAHRFQSCMQNNYHAIGLAYSLEDIQKLQKDIVNEMNKCLPSVLTVDNIAINDLELVQKLEWCEYGQIVLLLSAIGCAIFGVVDASRFVYESIFLK